MNYYNLYNVYISTEPYCTYLKIYSATAPAPLSELIGGKTHHRIVSIYKEYDFLIHVMSDEFNKKNIDHEVSRDENGLLTIYVPASFRVYG